MRNLLRLILLTVVAPVLAQSPGLNWAKGIGSENNEVANAVCSDARNNIYITGQFNGVVDFDPGSDTAILRSQSAPGIFVCKFDSAGQFLWARGIAGCVHDNAGTGIIVASDNSILITGYFSISADFDPGPATYTLGGAYLSSFLLRLSDDGEFMWAQKLATYSKVLSLTIDHNDNIYLGGQFQGLQDFDPGPATYSLFSPGGNDGYGPADGFILKLNSAGQFLWALNMGGVTDDVVFSVKVDDFNNVYACGVFRKTADFDPGPGITEITSKGFSDIFLWKLNTLGQLIWVKSFGGPGEDYAYSMAFDIQNNPYISGRFSDRVDFDPGKPEYNLVSLGAYDAFICKLSRSGNFVWAKNFSCGNSGGSVINYITLKNNNVYATGNFFGTMEITSGKQLRYLYSKGQTDIFTLKIDDTNMVWAIGYGGGYFDSGTSLTVNDQSEVYTVGYFERSVDFDPGKPVYLVSSNGLRDVFIQKMRESYIMNLNDLSLDSQGVFLFPNPADHEIHIRFNDKFSGIMEIIDASAQTVLQVKLKIKDEWTNINTSQIPPGTYQLVFRNELGQQVYLRKMMVCR